MLIIILFSGAFPMIAVAYYFVVLQRKSSSRHRQFKIYDIRRRGMSRKYLLFSNMTDEENDDDIAWLKKRYDEVHHSFTYFICLVPTVAISIFGWILFMLLVGIEAKAIEKPSLSNGEVFPILFMPHTVTLAMTFGFLGALVFGYQLIYQRFSNHDLNPAIFLRVALALFAGMVFNFVLFLTVENFSNGLESATAANTQSGGSHVWIGSVITAIVAFSLGYFPALAIKWFTRVSHSLVGESSRRSDFQSLSSVDGVSLFHEERLNEEGIYNIQDLAFADLGKLLVRTPFTAGQILDWVNQAKLYLHLDLSEADSFRRAGIRTASDLIDIWEPLLAKPNKEKSADKRKQLALSLQTIPERLDIVFGSLQRVNSDND